MSNIVKLNTQEFQIENIDIESYNRFVKDSVEKVNEEIRQKDETHIENVDLSSLKKMMSVLIDLYESDSKYLSTAFKDMYIQCKKKEKVKSLVKEDNISQYWSAINLYYYLKDQKRVKHTKAFNCAKDNLKKNGIETDKLYSIIQSFESFKKMKI
jgi:hypothetical protein